MVTIRRPKLRELKEAITALIKGPYTVKFPREPSVPPEAFRGKPEYVEEYCVGCGACSQVCPARAIEVKDEITGPRSGVRRITLHYDHCIFCGQCQCPFSSGMGIRLTNEYDLATFDRKEAVVGVEKELVLCEYCGAVISTVDHIRWIAEGMGPKAYASLGLVLALHEGLGLVEETAPRGDIPIGRSDHVRLLCPKCRRELIVREEWG